MVADAHQHIARHAGGSRSTVERLSGHEREAIGCPRARIERRLSVEGMPRIGSTLRRLNHESDRADWCADWCQPCQCVPVSVPVQSARPAIARARMRRRAGIFVPTRCQSARGCHKSCQRGCSQCVHNARSQCRFGGPAIAQAHARVSRLRRYFGDNMRDNLDDNFS